MLLKILQFYGVSGKHTPMGPLFVLKHKFLQCVCSIILYMFQKVCFFIMFLSVSSPSVKPKHNFFQKHKFLRCIMSNFSKTQVFTPNYEPVATSPLLPG